MKQLLIASSNNSKISEIRRALLGIPYQILDYYDVEMKDEIDEIGSSYEENASIKACAAGNRFHMLTIADDSGIEVDALGGKPGIYSARYAPGSDADRVQAMLRELSVVPEGKRTARYRCVIVLYDPDSKKICSFEGVCEGKILFSPEGGSGFGYDPIFYSFDLKKSFGVATEKEKESVSHRSRALSLARSSLR